MKHQFSPEQAKSRIVAGIRDLDRSDCNDICMMIKAVHPIVDNDIITVSARGTHFNLDRLEIPLLRSLDDMIASKLRRIYHDRN